jgi:hypothetical protein
MELIQARALRKAMFRLWLQVGSYVAARGSMMLF